MTGIFLSDSGDGGHAGFPPSENHANLSSSVKVGGISDISLTATRKSSKFGRDPISGGRYLRLLNETLGKESPLG